MLGRLLPRESRAVSYQALWANDDWPTSNTWSGQAISQTKALQIGAVYACIRLYVDTISTFPVGAFTRTSGSRLPAPRPDWMSEPYPGITWTRHVQQGLVSLLVNGNWYTRKIRNTARDVIGLVVLDPQRVEPHQRPDGSIYFLIDGVTPVERDDMIHITELVLPGQLKGVSRIDQVKQELGLAQALTEFAARFFANGTQLSGVIETPAVLDVEQATKALNTFEASHRGKNQHRPAVLGGGGKWVKASTAPNEAQMLESRQQAVEAIARVFKVPPFKIGLTNPGAMSYSSVEQMQIAWVQDSLQPYVSLIEDAYGWLLPRGQFVRLNMDALLRGDMQTRYESYSKGSDAGFLSINDIHRLEDMPPVPGGDEYRVGLENINLSAANLVELQKRIDMFVALVGQGADPTSAASVVGLPAITFESHVDGSTGARELNLVEAVQKVYLGVGTVITSDEARQMLNDAGANLTIPGPDLAGRPAGGAAA